MCRFSEYNLETAWAIKLQPIVTMPRVASSCVAVQEDESLHASEVHVDGGSVVSGKELRKMFEYCMFDHPQYCLTIQDQWVGYGSLWNVRFADCILHPAYSTFHLTHPSRW